MAAHMEAKGIQQIISLHKALLSNPLSVPFSLSQNDESEKGDWKKNKI